ALPAAHHFNDLRCHGAGYGCDRRPVPNSRPGGNPSGLLPDRPYSLSAALFRAQPFPRVAVGVPAALRYFVLFADPPRGRTALLPVGRQFLGPGRVLRRPQRGSYLVPGPLSAAAVSAD